MILNKKIILSIFFISLILFSVLFASAYVRSPYSSNYNNAMGLGIFSGSQSLRADESMCQQGTDFIMQIGPLSCTPTVVRSDLLEEEDVRVFCQLSATQINPFVDVKAIDWITFNNKDYPKEVLGLGYVPAQSAVGYSNKESLEGSAILQNLGYIVITLRQQPNESALRNCEKTALGTEVCWVEGNLTAKLRYDITNSFGVGKAEFYLPVMNDEEWQDNYVQYGFWEGRGYLRAESVDEDSASISVYSDDSVAKSLSKRDRQYQLAKYASNINLEKGERSERIFLPGISPCLAGLELTLNGIENPETRASLKINEDYIEVAEGEKFFENRCSVVSIDKSGINSKIKLRCKEDEKSQSTFELRVFPKVNLSINGKEKMYSVGDWLYKTEDGEKSIYLGYVGTEKETTNISDLYVYLVALPEHKEKLDSSEISSVASHANLLKSSSDSGAKVFDSGGKFLKYFSGKLVQLGKWTVKGESFYFIKYDEKARGLSQNSIVSGEKIEGKYISLNGFAGAEDKEFVTDDDSKLQYEEYYNNAIDDFDTVINSFSSEVEDKTSKQTLGEKALYEKISLANAVGKKRTMLDLCNQFEEEYPSSYRSLELCRDELKIANSEIATKEVTINGLTKTISFEEIKEPSLKDYSAKIIVKGPNGKTETYDLRKNQQILLNGFRSEEDQKKIPDNTEYIMLESLEEDTASIRLNVNQGFFDKNFVSNTETLKKGVSVLRGGYTFTIAEINLNKVAKVSVSSRTDFANSETSFKFKIGIEKRAIQLSPSKAQEKIADLNESITKWQKASDALYGVVKTMKTACLGAGAVLTVKNFVANAGGKSIARQEVMNGAGGWKEECAKMTEKYKTMDACFLDKANEIESDVDELYNIMKYQDEKIKEFQNANMQDREGFVQKYVNTSGFVKDYSEQVRNTLNSLKEEEKTELGIENINKILTPNGWESNQYTVEQLREIELYSLYLKSPGNKDVAMTRLTSVLSDVATNAKDYVEESTFEQKTGMGENSLVDSFDKIIKMKEIPVNADKRVFFKDTRYSKLNVESSEGVKPSEDYAYAIKDISNEGKNYVILYDYDGGVVQTYQVVETNGVEELKVYINDKDKNDKNPFDLRFKIYSTMSYENEYVSSYGKKEVLLKYYETSPYIGFPAVVPFDLKDGWYAGIKTPQTSYDLSGVVKSFWLCNVGENGIEEFQLEGFGDDICQLFNLDTGQKYTNFPGLSEDKSYQLVVKANNAIQIAQNARKKQEALTSVSINGKKIKVGEPAAQNPAAQCTDFMSPKDCSLLFNLCDPVICPSSRCNLGGNYPVQNVVQSGIIGSIALCYPNAKWNGGDVYVPVCLTGVQTGMDNWLSIQKSYRDCLQTSINTGETVGICDEINSIYVCEFFWKQALPIINTALPKLIGIITGQNNKGGGEYQGVSSAWDTAQDSIDYFKQYYAEESYRAFKVRSTEQVGTELCSTFVSATYPDSGSFLDNLVEPDSPIQFTGKFDENQLTTLTNPPTSHYKVYYHIYAGKDSGAYYQVYLRGSGSSYYRDTVQSRMVGAGYISRGGYTSNTTDFTAPSGYKELCISVNGQEECGFKEVSTSFAVNYVGDLYLAEQTTNTDIKTEKECVSGTASLYNLLNLNAQSAAENLINPALYSQGIIRICATDDPGVGTDKYAGTENAKWKKVGSCGDNKIGCWIDTKSVESVIKTKNIEQNALDEVSKDYVGYLSEDYLTPETFNSKFKEILEEKSIPKRIELINAIINKVFFNNQKAQLFFWRGKAYSELAIGEYDSIVGIEKFPCPYFCGIDENGNANLYYGIKYPDSIACEKSNIIYKKCEKGCNSTLNLCVEDLEFLGKPINTGGPLPVIPKFDEEFNKNYNSPWFLLNDRNILTFDDKCFRYYKTKWQFSTGCDANKNNPNFPWYNVEELGKAYTNPVSEGYEKIIISLVNMNGNYTGGLNILIYNTLQDNNAELSEESFRITSMNEEGIFTVEFKGATPIYYRYINSNWEWSPDEINWMGTRTTIVNGGKWDKQEPVQQNKNIINYLNEVNLYQGAAILFDSESEDIKELFGKSITTPSSLESSFEKRNQDKLSQLMKSLSTVVFKSNFNCYCGANCEDYAKWITEASETYNIPDELLLLAIMIQETSCKSVESSGGDLGLMQINTKVHCGKYSLASNIETCKNTLLADKEKNIKIGTQILKESYKLSSKGRIFICSGALPQFYSGWEAALRGYNGWGCTGDDNYVKNVESKYFELVDLYNGRYASPQTPTIPTQPEEEEEEISVVCTSYGDQGDHIWSMAVYNNKLWIGQGDGTLQSCDSSGTCISYGDQGDDIWSMAVYNNKLWIGQGDGTLQSCDSSGTCTSYGSKGAIIYSMAVYNNKLWIGQGDTTLQSCDSSGTCTSHGHKRNSINSMMIYNNKLWIGHYEGFLESCDSSGTCTSHGDKGFYLGSMAVYNNKLWIGLTDALQSCDSSGTCTSYGSKGYINSMAVYNNKLWIGDDDGTLQSCDSSGTCTSHGDKGDPTRSMAVYNNKLWIGQWGGTLQSCIPEVSPEEEVEEIFVVERNLLQTISGGTNMYYKYDNEWKWTPYSDYSVWMLATTTTVSKGEYNGKTPSSKNVEIINLLNGKNYNEGKKILKENDATMEDGSEIKVAFTTTTPTDNSVTPVINEDCDYEKINPPCTSFDKDVQKSMFTTAERKLFLEVKKCDECGTETLNFCDRDECKAIALKLRKNCVYTDYTFGGSCEEKISTTTPTLVCTSGQTKCESTTYYTCTNNAWINKGKVDGKCGYTLATSPTTLAIRNKIIETTEELVGKPYISYISLSSSQKAEIDKTKEIWTWKEIPIIRDYDASGGIPNCFDSVKHVYAEANVNFKGFDYCLKDLIVDVDKDSCQKDNLISKNSLEPGDILSIRYSSTIHNVIFIKWIDKSTGKAEVFDWIGTGDKSEFPSSWAGSTKNFREFQTILKFDGSSQDYSVYAVGKPVLA